MDKPIIEKSCAGECANPLHGLSYTCQKCGINYCYTCSYYARWKCPKCGERLS